MHFSRFFCWVNSESDSYVTLSSNFLTHDLCEKKTNPDILIDIL